MDLTERNYSVLAVSSQEKFNRALTELLSPSVYFPVKIAQSVSDAERRLAESSFDIVIINAPLPDDFGTRLALDLCDGSSACVLLLVKAEHYSDICAYAAPHGVLTLSKPTSMQTVRESLLLLCGTSNRLKRTERKAASLEEKMEEIRLINRAKLLLIEQLKMTEKEAHRHIEKQAMDRCVTKRKIAENIIATYK